ncbi:MAG: hypothetical protein NPIRA04_08060 [Nitrospirales bacterium]|nr:MAG: hypothetical protein NPIRA04_08060 [Nitrospirales bacterium]
MPRNDEDVVQGNDILVIYVDIFRIGYDVYKFVLDLGAVPSNSELPEFQVRVCIGPDDVKTLLEMIGQSIKEYEDRCGLINKQ